jgi:hypothetical protein
MSQLPVKTLAYAANSIGTEVRSISSGPWMGDKMVRQVNDAAGS